MKIRNYMLYRCSKCKNEVNPVVSRRIQMDFMLGEVVEIETICPICLHKKVVKEINNNTDNKVYSLKERMKEF